MKRGFTVVELMIVLAIAALLCTVIFIAIKAPVKYDDVKLNPADNTRCRAGVVVYKGQTLIFNGQTILCKRENT